MSKITKIKITSMSRWGRFILGLIFGVVIVAAAVITIFYFSKETNFFDQYDAIAVWQNNSEGNWDIAYSIYKQPSNKWFHQPDTNIYYEGDANLIAKLKGDDNDPDISSTKHTAMAVWSNTGMDGNIGSDIFISTWNTEGWTKPTRLFAFAGDDSDPTIYMQDPNNALVAWVNKNSKGSAIYYSVYNGGHWTSPQQAFSAQAIASPELGYITVKGSRYLLSFTASTDNGDLAYIGSYGQANGWEIMPIKNQSSKAIVNESVPAPYRTSSSMHESSHNVAVSWPADDDSVQYMQASPASTDFAAQRLTDGGNAVILHEPTHPSGYATILVANQNSLFNINVVGEDSSQKISPAEKGLVRPDATYLIEPSKYTAIAVWDTDKESPSEIYFSVLNNKSQEWSLPDRIDTAGLPGEDKNPAITPILVRFTEENVISGEDDFYVEEAIYCGDGILQKKLLEECEIGVACKNKDEICDWDYYTKIVGKAWAGFFADCECLVPDDKITPPTPKKKDGTAKKTQPKEASYGGASCGFNEVVLKSAIGTGEVDMQFLPESNPKNGVVKLFGDYPMYQADAMYIFPLGVGGSESRLVTMEFSNDNQRITMTGFDESIGFQLCTGVFDKGAPPGSTKFVPAPAGADSFDNVPNIPGN